MEVKLHKLEDTVKNLEQLLAEEANEGKVIRNQLQKMESKLTDTLRNREQLAAQIQEELEKVLSQISCELQKVWIKILVSAFAGLTKNNVRY
jgi:DNA anti-recombination protein RmuC